MTSCLPNTSIRKQLLNYENLFCQNGEYHLAKVCKINSNRIAKLEKRVTLRKKQLSTTQRKIYEIEDYISKLEDYDHKWSNEAQNFEDKVMTAQQCILFKQKNEISSILNNEQKSNKDSNLHPSREVLQIADQMVKSGSIGDYDSALFYQRELANLITELRREHENIHNGQIKVKIANLLERHRRDYDFFVNEVKLCHSGKESSRQNELNSLISRRENVLKH